MFYYKIYPSLHVLSSPVKYSEKEFEEMVNKTVVETIRRWLGSAKECIANGKVSREFNYFFVESEGVVDIGRQVTTIEKEFCELYKFELITMTATFEFPEIDYEYSDYVRDMRNDMLSRGVPGEMLDQLKSTYDELRKLK